MSVYDRHEIMIEPIISYPREAQVGTSYLMTIDLRVTTNADNWPYEEEEYPVWFILDTMPLFSHEPLGETAVIAHRFGGTYGPATFRLTAAQEEMTGTIRVTLLNDWGIPLKQFELKSRVALAEEAKQKILLTERKRSGVRTLQKMATQHIQSNYDAFAATLVAFDEIDTEIAATEPGSERQGKSEKDLVAAIRTFAKQGTAIEQALLDWIDASTQREARRFLEAHSELLVPSSDDILIALIEQHAEEKEIVHTLRHHLELLRDARARGGSREAIREAYVNMYGGLALDLPSWLEMIEQRLTNLFQEGLSHQTATEYKELLNKALIRAQDDPSVAPETLAELYLVLGDALRENSSRNRTQACEAAIHAYTTALQTYTFTHYPYHYALLQYDLGMVHLERLAGERSTNIEQAITCYEAALQVYTHAIFPREWALTQYSLGTAYRERITGERRVNLEQAIVHYQNALQVFTPDTFPLEWAATQNNLGNASLYRIEGTWRTNLEQAITYYEAALRIYTRDDFPTKWAMVLNNLGNAYRERIEGGKLANIEQAIACYQHIFQIYSHDTFPVEWARTQSNLGIAYQERIAGERRTNLEQAITCYHASLQIYTRETFPFEWALTQHHLGTAYRERIEGERSNNLEQALACYHAALEIFTRETFPLAWIKTLNELGIAYRERLVGERRMNIERAIACYQDALQVCTRDTLPVDWAITQNNLGNAYRERVAGEQRTNLEQAIACYQAALEIYTPDTFPVEWAMLQNNLGNAYQERREGEQRENIERAIACYQAALRVYTLDTFPFDCAKTLNNLGDAYRKHIGGERYIHLEQAIACHETALRVFTLDAFPADHRRTQLNLALAEAERQNWEAVHTACTHALAAEDMLIRLSADVSGRDAILREGRGAATLDGFALVRLGRIAEAAVTIERGRARWLAEALTLDTAEPTLINDPERRSRYIEARQGLIAALAALNASSAPDLSEYEHRRVQLERTETYHQAKNAFDAVVAEIREAEDPSDFLEETLDAPAILGAAQTCGAGHAVVYLAATPFGGVAIAALSTNSHFGTQARFAALDLPALTEAYISDLIETRLDDGTQRVVGGYLHAQEGNGLSLLRQQWASETFREGAIALHVVCAAANQKSSLDAAIQEMLNIPSLGDSIDQPFDKLDGHAKATLESITGHYLLQLELQRCFETLAGIALGPLVTWLLEQGTTSLTLIPCGQLAAFPLTTVPVVEGRTVGEMLQTSIAPSARSLLHYDYHVSKREGVYALGNPLPTRPVLPWSEAEALTLVKLARRLGWPVYAAVQGKATRRWLIQALQRGFVVDVSCPGKFDTYSPLDSALWLTKGQRLRLGDVLNHQVDLRGLRLLILSAAQTAVIDVRGAVDEMRSMATGMIQAGARAVLATLWSVDDKATYLLLVRFAQEWFPKMNSEPPAAALARVQHWLRTVTNHQLQQWNSTDLLGLSTDKLQTPWDKEPETEAEREAREKSTEPWDKDVRYDQYTAEELIRETAHRENPDAQPYADPLYWAGFQLIGW